MTSPAPRGDARTSSRRGAPPPAVRAPSTVAAGTRQPLQISVSAVDAEGDPITSLTAAPLPPATFTTGGLHQSGLFQ